jgi:hypothetical protein
MHNRLQNLEEANPSGPNDPNFGIIGTQQDNDIYIFPAQPTDKSLNTQTWITKRTG